MHGYTRVKLATVLTSQPTISDMLRRARSTPPDIRPGTRGGTTYEISAGHGAGEIDRAVALREPTERQYATPPKRIQLNGRTTPDSRKQLQRPDRTGPMQWPSYRRGLRRDP